MLSVTPTVGFIEHRRCSRYHLRLPVLFSWTQGSHNQSAGFTRDIGVGGVFIFARECPPCGAVLEVNLVVPVPAETAQEIHLRCIGTVVRIDNLARHGGFAVVGDFGCDRYSGFSTADWSGRDEEE
jgi:hypothetical protein